MRRGQCDKHARLDTHAVSWHLFEVTHLPLSLIRGEIKSFIVLFSWPLFVAPHLGVAHRNTDGGGVEVEVVVGGSDQQMHARTSSVCSHVCLLDVGKFASGTRCTSGLKCNIYLYGQHSRSRALMSLRVRTWTLSSATRALSTGWLQLGLTGLVQGHLCGANEKGEGASLTTVLDKSRRVPGTEGGPGQRLACLAEQNAFFFFYSESNNAVL